MTKCVKCDKEMTAWAERNCEGFCTTCFHQTLPYTPPEVDVVDEDWLAGVSCNPDAPEECESCQ